MTRQEKIMLIDSLTKRFLNRKYFCCTILICLYFVFVYSCSNVSNEPITSTGLSIEQKLKTLKSFITPKSQILDCEFKLFDVNYKNRSIPGASSVAGHFNFRHLWALQNPPL